jgi:hypothetical protein
VSDFTELSFTLESLGARLRWLERELADSIRREEEAHRAVARLHDELAKMRARIESLEARMSQ